MERLLPAYRGDFEWCLSVQRVHAPLGLGLMSIISNPEDVRHNIGKYIAKTEMNLLAFTHCNARQEGRPSKPRQLS